MHAKNSFQNKTRINIHTLTWSEVRIWSRLLRLLFLVTALRYFPHACPECPGLSNKNLWHQLEGEDRSDKNLRLLSACVCAMLIIYIRLGHNNIVSTVIFPSKGITHTHTHAHACFLWEWWWPDPRNINSRQTDLTNRIPFTQRWKQHNPNSYYLCTYLITTWPIWRTYATCLHYNLSHSSTRHDTNNCIIVQTVPFIFGADRNRFNYQVYWIQRAFPSAVNMDFDVISKSISSYIKIWEITTH